jgi:hypothetical protein
LNGTIKETRVNLAFSVKTAFDLLACHVLLQLLIAGGPEDSEQEGDGDRSKDNNSKSGAVAARASGVLITLASIIWMFPGF